VAALRSSISEETRLKLKSEIGYKLEPPHGGSYVMEQNLVLMAAGVLVFWKWLG
jgi:hypothetical protein